MEPQRRFTGARHRPAERRGADGSPASEAGPSSGSAAATPRLGCQRPLTSVPKPSQKQHNYGKIRLRVEKETPGWAAGGRGAM